MQQTRAWFLAGMFLSILGGCHNHTASSNPSYSISVDREILLREVKISPTALTRLKDGGFVITGGALTIRTNDRGAVLWKYSSSPDRSESAQGRFSSFAYGAALLSDGRILLCGETRLNGWASNAITILDKEGNLIERRTVAPPSARSFKNSGFVKCFPWNDRISLVGYGNDGAAGYSWIVSLNEAGEDERQTLSPLPMDTMIPIPSASYLVLAGLPDEKTIALRQVGPDGSVTATATMPGQLSLFLRPTSTDAPTFIVTYAGRGEGKLHALDVALHDIQSPVRIGDFDASQGCGYALMDGSILPFGRQTYAAIGWIDKSGKPLAVKQFDETRSGSYSMSQAVALSDSAFVAIRYNVSTNVNEQGLIISWITLHTS